MPFGKPTPPHVMLEQKLDLIIEKLDQLEIEAGYEPESLHGYISKPRMFEKPAPPHIILDEKLDLILRKLEKLTSLIQD